MEPSARRGRDRRLAWVMVPVFLLDLIVVRLSAMAAWEVRDEIDGYFVAPYDPVTAASVTVLMLVVWMAVLQAIGAYESERFAGGFDEFRRIAQGTAITLGLVGTIGFLTHSTISRGYVLLTFIIGMPALMVVRYVDRKILHALRARGHFLKNVVAVGSVAAVDELVQVLAREAWTGYRVIGHVTTSGDADEAESALVPLLGRTADIGSIVVEHEARSVLVAGGSMSSAADLRHMGWKLEGLDIDLLVVPSLTDIAGPRVRFRHLAGLPLVHVRESRISEASGLLKRIFDLVVGSLMLLVAAVPMLVVALLVKLQDGGPVFYRQPRVGQDRQTFGMLKFRSMVVDADKKLATLTSDSEGVLFKMKDDPRVTPVGRWIRRYSVDELPQLFNVLSGDMSLVGPRPPLPSEVDRYEEHVGRRLLVRPGLTGLWQVSGRSDLTWDEAVRLDLYYVDNWSLVGDFVILLKTIRAVLVSEGAY